MIGITDIMDVLPVTNCFLNTNVALPYFFNQLKPDDHIIL